MLSGIGDLAGAQIRRTLVRNRNPQRDEKKKTQGRCIRDWGGGGGEGFRRAAKFGGSEKGGHSVGIPSERRSLPFRRGTRRTFAKGVAEGPMKKKYSLRDSSKEARKVGREGGSAIEMEEGKKKRSCEAISELNQQRRGKPVLY